MSLTNHCTNEEPLPIRRRNVKGEDACVTNEMNSSVAQPVVTQPTTLRQDVVIESDIAEEVPCGPTGGTVKTGSATVRREPGGGKALPKVLAVDHKVSGRRPVVRINKVIRGLGAELGQPAETAGESTDEGDGVRQRARRSLTHRVPADGQVG